PAQDLFHSFASLLLLRRCISGHEFGHLFAMASDRDRLAGLDFVQQLGKFGLRLEGTHGHHAFGSTSQPVGSLPDYFLRINSLGRACAYARAKCSTLAPMETEGGCSCHSWSSSFCIASALRSPANRLLTTELTV